MRPTITHVSIGEMLPHLLTGAGLGVLLALYLIVSNDKIFQMIAASPSPRLAVLTLLGALSSILAVCSGITGFIFTAMEKE